MYDPLGINKYSVTLRNLQKVYMYNKIQGPFCTPSPVDGNILELVLDQNKEVLQACAKYLADLSHDSSREKCKEDGILDRTWAQPAT